MNGDSYTDADLVQFMSDFRESNADASIVVVPAGGRSDCGLVMVDGKGKLVGFEGETAFI